MLSHSGYLVQNHLWQYDSVFMSTRNSFLKSNLSGHLYLEVQKIHCPPLPASSEQKILGILPKAGFNLQSYSCYGKCLHFSWNYTTVTQHFITIFHTYHGISWDTQTGMTCHCTGTDIGPCSALKTVLLKTGHGTGSSKKVQTQR